MKKFVWICINRKCKRYDTYIISEPGGGGELNCEICDKRMKKHMTPNEKIGN